MIVFVTGPCSSGTTIISRFLTELSSTIGMWEDGPSHNHFLEQKILEANKIAFDEENDFQQNEYHKKRLTKMCNDFLSISPIEDKKYLIFKRSPFNKYRIDLIDLPDSLKEKIIISYRNPIEASFSSFSNKMGKTIRECAMKQCDQLTNLSLQAQKINPDNLIVIPYEELCTNPLKIAKTILTFLNIKENNLIKIIKKIKIKKPNESWKKEISLKELQSLEEFIQQREFQWGWLRQKSFNFLK